MTQPVVDIVAPVTQPVVDIIAPVTQPVIDIVAPVTQPVVDIVAPITQPVVDIIAPITQPVVDIVAPITQPVVDIIAPITQPVVDVVAPVTQPIVDIVARSQPSSTSSPRLPCLWSTSSPRIQPVIRIVAPVTQPVVDIVAPTTSDIIEPGTERQAPALAPSQSHRSRNQTEPSCDGAQLMEPGPAMAPACRPNRRLRPQRPPRRLDLSDPQADRGQQHRAVQYLVAHRRTGRESGPEQWPRRYHR